MKIRAANEANPLDEDLALVDTAAYILRQEEHNDPSAVSLPAIDNLSFATNVLTKIRVQHISPEAILRVCNNEVSTSPQTTINTADSIFPDHPSRSRSTPVAATHTLDDNLLPRMNYSSCHR